MGTCPLISSEAFDFCHVWRVHPALLNAMTTVTIIVAAGIFYENGQNVTTNYTITNGKNAMSAGPITIDSGVTVTVGSGETWTVV